MNQSTLKMFPALTCRGRSLAKQRGVTSIEYALLASLIAVMIAVNVDVVGAAVKSMYGIVSSKVSQVVQQTGAGN